MNPNDKQVGGSHYQSEYQHWDFVRLGLHGRYLEGCATKYVSRWRDKGGAQDLEKALHYVEKIMALANETLYRGPSFDHPSDEQDCRWEAMEFINLNRIPNAEADIIVGLATWMGELDLQRVHNQLSLLIAKERS